MVFQLIMPTISLLLHQEGVRNKMSRNQSFSVITTECGWKVAEEIFMRMIELHTLNDLVLYVHNNPEKKTKSIHRGFQETLAIQLTQGLLDTRNKE